MKHLPISSVLILLLILPLSTMAQSGQNQPDVEVSIDGDTCLLAPDNVPQDFPMDPDSITGIDIVGGTDSSAYNFARAKGNSYRIDTGVSLDQAEFYLNFSDTQTLTFYLFVGPEEFGTYTEVYRDSQTLTGSGEAWYSSGPLYLYLDQGSYYIIAVSWTGDMTYYFNTGEFQDTSFGAAVNAFASGYDPLPSSFEMNTNDVAIYYQRLTTDTVVPTDGVSMDAIKAMFR